MKTEQPKYIILLGPPGSGKGTQAKLLQKHYDLVHISTGDLLRQEIADQTEFGKRMKAIMDQGLFPSNEEVTEVLENRMKKSDCIPGIIFDGYPRTLAQADYLLQRLSQPPIVILIKISDNLIAERIVFRRNCPKCGASYHLKYNLPKKEGICDKDGEILVQRNDDKANVLKQRLEIYQNLTAPLIDYYEKRHLLHTIESDNLSIHEIFTKIKEIANQTH